MIDTYQLDNLRRRIDLREFMRQHRPLSTSRHLSPNRKQIAMPCPQCGGVDRFCVSRDVWLCRQCAPAEPGRRRDVFELIEFLGLATDFLGAVEYVARWVGDTQLAERIANQRVCSGLDRIELAVESRLGATTPPYEATPHRQTNQRRYVTSEWIAAHVAKAATRLPGSPGDDYLSGRGLSAMTMKAFKLGYQSDVQLPYIDRKEPAIVIPWIDDGKITRLGYRYLTTHEYTDQDGRKQSCKYKIMAALAYQPDALFGLHLLSQSATLIITEGELNCASCWQEFNSDVVSFGSQTVHKQQLDRLAALATNYPHVVVWADEPKNVREIEAALAGHGNVTAIKSPRGMDANDLLQRGLLTEFLAKLTGQRDVTDYVGRNVTGTELDAIRRGLQVGWSIESTPVANGTYQINGLIARPQEN
ncbi:MAG: hypothetical protein U0350_49315 [Caldilineaceae bacterium]